MLMFYVFGAVAVVASLLVIGQRNPIYSVLLLIASFGALSGLYVLLDAPFVAVIQIIVYAGAIMVLFLFVVMLLNAPHEETAYDGRLHPLLRGGPTRLGAARCKEWGVATELKRVAEALLPPHQDPLSFDRNSVLQGWNPGMAARPRVFALPAKLVFFPSQFELPEQKPRKRLVPMGIGVSGVEAQRPGIGSQALVVAPEVVQYLAPIHPSRRVVGPQFQGPVIVGERFIVAM